MTPNALQARPQGWSEEFQNSQQPRNGWADEFAQASLTSTSGAAQQQNGAQALEQTRALADTLSKDANPKFQNSKFLQFVSKMSRGEIILEDNQVRLPSNCSLRWMHCTRAGMALHGHSLLLPVFGHDL